MKWRQGSRRCKEPGQLDRGHSHFGAAAHDGFACDDAALTGYGQKFLINRKVDEPNPPPLSIILNWASEKEK
jgi:hypothetical protein